MADLSNDIRLAVDSGKVAFGIKEATATIADSSAKAVVVASVNKDGRVHDVMHMAKISEIKVLLFKGNPADLGVVCGKPYSVSALSVVNPGSSNILNETY